MGEVKEVWMEEEEESKYLGIIFQRKHNIYSTQHKKIKKNMFASATTMQNIIGNMLKPINIIYDTWYIYIEPVIIYGLESIGYTVNYLKELDKLQAQYLKNILRLPRYVANEAVYIITNIRPISHTVLHRRIQFYRYIMEHPENKWVYEMMQLQKKWIAEEALIMEERVINDSTVKGGMSYLMKEIIKQLKEHPFHDRIVEAVG